MATDSRAVLRIEAEGNIPLSSMRNFLEAFENAYNSVYVFDVFITDPERLSPSEPFSSLLSAQPMALRVQLLAWVIATQPSAQEQIARLVPVGDRVILRAVHLGSPGHLDFEGLRDSLAAIQHFLGVLGQILKLRKQADTVKTQRRKEELENELLENHVIRERIDMAMLAGADPELVRMLANRLVINSLAELGHHEAHGTITGVGPLEPGNGRYGQSHP